jgi:type I thyroxine 5'-deiodinase
LNRLQKRYGDRVALYVVYIQEAHPVDGWQMRSNVREGILFRTTKALPERSEIAGACLMRLGLKIPALVDLPDDRVERAYTGWPDRLYIIDTTGRIAYKSDPGPFGFRPADLTAVLNGLFAAGRFR